MKLRTIREAPIKKGTRVLMRADFDVAIKNGMPESAFRVEKNLSTIRLILKKGGHLRVCSHRGRPHGKKEKSLSLKALVPYLNRALKKEVIFIKNPFSQKVFGRYNESPHILLFENLRFWPGEEKNDFSFAQGVAKWGDLFVNEAFANAHRSHAGVVQLPKILPAYAGLHFTKEVENLSRIFKKPKRPFVAVLGGAKLETKLPLVNRFLKEADRVLIGGEIANTILAHIGKLTARTLVKGAWRGKFDATGKKLELPFDFITTATPHSGKRCAIKNAAEVKPNEYVVDIGPRTVRKYSFLLRGAKTIVWNGPLGLIEIPAFSEGTIQFAKEMARTKAFKVIGGGDTVAVLGKYHLLKGYSYVSTGGGAMLEFLAGKNLPGIKPLQKR